MNQSENQPRFKRKVSPIEDLRLTEIVARCGSVNWALVAAQMPGRNPRQCRERWMNYINPDLNHAPLSVDEDQLFDAKYRELGSRWQVIATFLPGRGKNFLKNHWISRQKRLAGDNAVTLANQDAEPERGYLNVFDLAFQQEEKQESFWELIAAGYL
jgi:hypothetical protein